MEREGGKAILLPEIGIAFRILSRRSALAVQRKPVSTPLGSGSKETLGLVSSRFQVGVGLVDGRW